MRNQIRVFLQIAREHDERLSFALRQLDDAFDPVWPVGFAAEMIDHDRARVLQDIVEIEIDRRRLTQIGDVRQAQARKAGTEPIDHSRQQRERGIGRTENDDLARALIDADNPGRVIDKAARNRT